MGYMKLKKLTVSGENKSDSIIEFGSKLTIIAGPSETGKSTIYRCLDYIFSKLIDLNTSDQMVIIENTKYHELPAFTNDENAKIYKFTQFEEGRYGFLSDVKLNKEDL